ncbi:MAG TPA: glycosyltransferase family 1 protein [Pirellulales bacterium]|nr:glycosyltransferase family 1 protein [Pirellulales bacterium]
MHRRIAMISEHASPLCCLGGIDSGGQNVYVDQVARGLGRIGYDVDVFTRRDADDLPTIVELAPRVQVVHIKAGPARRVPKEELLPYIDEFSDRMATFCGGRATYDLAHANFWMSGLVAARLKRRCGLPFVITFHALGKVRRLHQGGADRFPPQRLAIEGAIMNEADLIIAECPQDEDDQIRLYGADPCKIHIVPCGFDAAELWPIDRAEARRWLGLDPDERIVLHVGRMAPRKGVDDAIVAFARLQKRHRIVARMIVVGGETDDADPRATPEIGRLKQIAADEGVADRVIFTGRRDRQALKYYYSAADVFVTAPWYEPFGITPVEAMACGTPVIGTNVGGIKFTVRDGQTGFLAPPHDPEALAEKMAEFFASPDRAAKMSQQAIRRANDLFTWRQVGRQIADVYEQVLTQQRPAFAESAVDSIPSADASALSLKG